jgi:hypothetical protein
MASVDVSVLEAERNIAEMIRLALFFGLLAHIAVAVWNGFYGPSFGAEGDALAFHFEAISFSNNLEHFSYQTGWIYSYFLGVLYSIFTDHIFFGSLISVAAWFLSALLIKSIMELLKIEKTQIVIAILIYSLWPSALLNSSVTLREAFQSLGVAIICYSSISIFATGKNRWATLISGMIMASVLHGALMAFSSIIFAFIILYTARERFSLGPFGGTIFLVIFGGFCLVIGIFLLGEFGYDLQSGIVDAIQGYNEGAIAANARADYRTSLDISDPIDLLLFLPRALFGYMLEPLPWRIGNPADAVLFLENSFRIILLFVAFRKNKSLVGEDRAPHSFLLVGYVTLSLIWSVGTVNWGTASRHHAPSLVMLCIAAVYSRQSSDRRRLARGRVNRPRHMIGLSAASTQRRSAPR